MGRQVWSIMSLGTVTEEKEKAHWTSPRTSWFTDEKLDHLGLIPKQRTIEEWKKDDGGCQVHSVRFPVYISTSTSLFLYVLFYLIFFAISKKERKKDNAVLLPCARTV